MRQVIINLSYNKVKLKFFRNIDTGVFLPYKVIQMSDVVTRVCQNGARPLKYA
jgi:hypothetical protein